MHEVVSAISHISTLFVEAPTGIGKTISALFPAIKSLGHGKCDKIFYLTAKTATRSVAEKALSDLREKGLVLRSITLQAKESMCPCPDIL
jgi:DNA excision repair protein ERCC-2